MNIEEISKKILHSLISTKNAFHHLMNNHYNKKRRYNKEKLTFKFNLYEKVYF
jgi:hypothetical protein